MKILLILSSKINAGAGIVVRVKDKSVRNRVMALLEKNREREAFILLKKKAEPETYFAPGQRPKESFVTLVEDDLHG
ncbi:MAG: hypothetical protein HQL13_05055 [Candidatus Omnitrophica bacterium]|nr:hypothetical protein [Candidatus Omnitrophota bacterium]